MQDFEIAFNKNMEYTYSISGIFPDTFKQAYAISNSNMICKDNKLFLTERQTQFDFSRKFIQKSLDEN